jgi:hypothetical protein
MTFLTMMLAAGNAAMAAANRVSDQQAAADPRGTVEVSNVAGKVEVSTWDQPQVSVHAEVAEGVDRVEVSSESGRTVITVRTPEFSWFSSADNTANLTIRIPRNSALEVSTVSALVSSTGVLGTQHLKTVSGSITADIAQADVETKTVSGAVALRGASQPATLHMSSVSGGIRLEHGAGNVEASTVSGPVNVQVEPGREVRARTTSGQIVIRGRLAADADVDVQTVSGEVTLQAVPDGGYGYDLSSLSGNIRNCFKADEEQVRSRGPGTRLSGTYGSPGAPPEPPSVAGPGTRQGGTQGSGGGHVRVKTLSGRIDLCDK